jgi:hypothetical protein
MSEPTKVHVSGEAKKIIEEYQKYAQGQVKDIGWVTQTAAIDALVRAGYEKLTGKKPKK